MNLKSSQASFSSSSSSAADVNDTIVGTHSMVSVAVSPAGILVLSFKTLVKQFMFKKSRVSLCITCMSPNKLFTLVTLQGISEGEVRRSVGRNNNPVVRPLAKFASHGRTLNTITTTTKISDEEIDDEDTFAGVPSITDSPAPQNSGTKVRQSLPITHQLSPGEVRRPFLHHSSQPAVVDTDVSMPLSIGEVPHTLRNKTTVGSTKVPKLASLDKHTDITPHRVAHSEHHSFSAPSDNFENETRDGIDVINVSRNRDQSFSSPAASYTLSPSSPLIISSSEPPATHSPTTRLIRVSEAPQEPSSPDSHLYRQGRQIPTQAPPLAATSLLSSHSKPTNLKGVSSPSRPVQAGHSYQSENMINSGSNHRANLHSTPLSSNQLKRQQPHLQAVRVVAALDDKEHEHRRENSMLHQEESEERADQQLVDSSLPTLTFTAVSSDYSTLSSTTSF